MMTFAVSSDGKSAERIGAFALRFFFILSLFFSLPLHAQWTSVAPSLLGIQDITMGSITHKSGLTWAGSLKVVFMSPDSGITWINRSPRILGNDFLVDITFYDNKTGLVCTHNGAVLRTDDQGITWREIHRAGANGAAFLGSADNIVIATGACQTCATTEVSHDGGITWKSQILGDWIPQVRSLLGGSALILAGTKVGLSLFKTTDYGVSWQKMPGIVDFDSWSFDVNPCNPQFIYVINEEGTIVTSNKSEIFQTIDGGNSWTVSQSFPRLYFSGSIALTTKAVFAQTVGQGIRRSTDQGATWKGIGGPSVTWDTRLLCAINSNIVLAADNNGTIWRTVNSGGDSILNISEFESLALNPSELFAFDTLVSCDTPVIGIVHLNAILCKYPKIIGQKIIGKDSLDYIIIQPLGDSLTGNDSVILSFHPLTSGVQTGEYIITLEDSTQVSVPLNGFGRNEIFVAPKTADIAIDTIGGYAQVPISFIGFSQKEDLEIVLHYDNRMIYNSSISLNGIPLDIPGEAWQGRAKIRIPKSELQLDTISAIAIFTVFPDGNDCFTVTLDSMNILNPTATCTYSIGNPAIATICPPKGCGIMTLTNYMEHGLMPQLSIRPNPNQGAASITSSISLGDASVEVVDMLGRIYQRTNILLNKEMPVQLELGDLHTGSYYLRVRSQGLRYQLPVAIIR